MNYSRIALTALLLCSMTAISSIAEEALEIAEEAAEKDKLELSITLGGALNDGNTDNESGTFGFDLKHRIDLIEYSINAKGIITRTTSDETITEADGTTYTREKKETTAKNGEIKGNLSRDISDAVAVYVNATAFADEMSDIDYRFMTGPGLAFKLINTETITFTFELGLAGIWEKQDRTSDYYTAIRSLEKFEYSFSNGAKLWQSCEYLPSIEDSDKYLINSEIGVESPLNDILSLRLTATDRYNSMPSDDSEENDLSLIAGVCVKL